MTDRTMKTTERSGRDAGFSLIEVLVASVFLLVLILGVLPIFTRSTVINQMAYDNTRAASFARTDMENYFQSPFYDPGVVQKMTVPAGQTSLVVDEYFDSATKTGLPGSAPAGTRYDWSKKITVRQFFISAIDKKFLDEADALDGNADPGNVHLKQVLIEIQRGSQSSLLGPPRTITLNTIRSN